MVPPVPGVALSTWECCSSQPTLHFTRSSRGIRPSQQGSIFGQWPYLTHRRVSSQQLATQLDSQAPLGTASLTFTRTPVKLWTVNANLLWCNKDCQITYQNKLSLLSLQTVSVSLCKQSTSLKGVSQPHHPYPCAFVPNHLGEVEILPRTS